jgi:hypothetical protein
MLGLSYQPLKVIPKRGKAILVRPEEQRQLNEPITNWQQTGPVHFPMFQQQPFNQKQILQLFKL